MEIVFCKRETVHPLVKLLSGRGCMQPEMRVHQQLKTTALKHNCGGNTSVTLHEMLTSLSPQGKKTASVYSHRVGSTVYSVHVPGEQAPF